MLFHCLKEVCNKKIPAQFLMSFSNKLKSLDSTNDKNINVYYKHHHHWSLKNSFAHFSTVSIQKAYQIYAKK